MSWKSTPLPVYVTFSEGRIRTLFGVYWQHWKVTDASAANAGDARHANASSANAHMDRYMVINDATHPIILPG